MKELATKYSHRRMYICLHTVSAWIQKFFAACTITTITAAYAHYDYVISHFLQNK